METLKERRRFAKPPDDWCFSFDLKDGYYHVGIDPAWGCLKSLRPLLLTGLVQLPQHWEQVRDASWVQSLAASSKEQIEL
ncbi:hypothetical protein CYMTET_43292 [Cymbomonas tetramitiformis]|uniref:Uncharacterized protein n=1 Tax=Cymbomonas tetramitiformis TaxID=36881 RepID=A0AAE0C4D0_9CHLO|nr:hypothetical protein CYMTET_43294 [Cymbomonas tetramitiformis]KAK3247200.1 hypothetical protein CYMTET_43292 [Cymbomonas tetramitiformis]